MEITIIHTVQITNVIKDATDVSTLLSEEVQRALTEQIKHDLIADDVLNLDFQVFVNHEATV